MFDLSSYDEWLVSTEKGLGVSADCPIDVLKELKELDAEYVKMYDEHLLHFPK
jgi:hypothetical protein